MRTTTILAALPVLLGAVGCSQLSIPDGRDPTVPETCDTLVAEFVAETASIRSCDVAEDCGQVLAGTSCGCTRDWVARTDADTTRFYDLIDQGTALQCDLGLGSPCDCPPADGFDCVEGTCQWAPPRPEDVDFSDCTAAEGQATSIDSVVVRGGVLRVRASYGGGCVPHDFTICWPDQAFGESEPVTARLELLHQSEPDPCDGWITESLSFDLAPLTEAYQEQYAEHGRIAIRLGEHRVLYGF